MMARAKTTTKAMVATATKEMEMASRVAKEVEITMTISSSSVRVAISVSPRVADNTRTVEGRDSMTTGKNPKEVDLKEDSVVQEVASISVHR